ncbi:hypothetical protein I552_1533 [Mycobacterium xenopi 3993]|nr:hypothetical protein I552_1533 [Mycobacterium xenopi 3993]
MRWPGCGSQPGDELAKIVSPRPAKQLFEAFWCPAERRPSAPGGAGASASRRERACAGVASRGGAIGAEFSCSCDALGGATKESQPPYGNGDSLDHGAQLDVTLT